VKYHVCREEDVPVGQMRTYTVKNLPVVVVHSKKGEFYAIYGICPHQRSLLGQGVLGGLTEAGAPGEEFRYTREGEIIRCAWHGFDYDVITGTCLTAPEKLRVRTYPVTIDEREVYVEM